MLGNQYFMARKYSEAMAELESALQSDPNNIKIKKKLVICYTQTDRMMDSFDLFYKLVNENPKIIIDTDPILDDCPCPEIIQYLSSNAGQSHQLNNNLMMGILWLYCDITKSQHYFELYCKDSPKDKRAAEIIKILSDESESK